MAQLTQYWLNLILLHRDGGGDRVGENWSRDCNYPWYWDIAPLPSSAIFRPHHLHTSLPLHQPGAVSRVTSWRASTLLPATGGYNGLQASQLGKREHISGQSPTKKRRVGDLLWRLTPEPREAECWPGPPVLTSPPGDKVTTLSGYLQSSDILLTESCLEPVFISNINAIVARV